MTGCVNVDTGCRHLRLAMTPTVLIGLRVVSCVSNYHEFIAAHLVLYSVWLCNIDVSHSLYAHLVSFTQSLRCDFMVWQHSGKRFDCVMHAGRRPSLQHPDLLTVQPVLASGTIFNCLISTSNFCALLCGLSSEAYSFF